MMTDALADVRSELRSDRPFVVVEAPAGTGKTHEAAALALHAREGIVPGSEVLLLAHTNAAIDEFRGRIPDSRRIRISTFDAFMIELLGMHTRAAGLPDPLRPAWRDPGWFDSAEAQAISLLRRSPSMARQIALHHPFVILDEHQDSRPAQHGVAMLLRDHGARVRAFGDPMQSIFDFGPVGVVPWGDVIGDADSVNELTEPQRWSHAPELGRWLIEARRALRDGDSLPVREAPASVRVERSDRLGDVHPRSERAPVEIARQLRGACSSGSSTVALLVPYRTQVKPVGGAAGIARAWEGHDMPLARESLAAAVDAVGDGARMVAAILDFAASSCVGLNATIRTQVEACFATSSVTTGRRVRVGPLVEILKPAFATPDLSTWQATLRDLRQGCPPFLDIRLRDSWFALEQARFDADMDAAQDALSASIRRRQIAGRIPRAMVSTVHKAKGLAFDRVVVVHCSETPYPDDEAHRHLLYVAITRACSELVILASASHPSPLLG